MSFGRRRARAAWVAGLTAALLTACDTGPNQPIGPPFAQPPTAQPPTGPPAAQLGVSTPVLNDNLASIAPGRHNLGEPVAQWQPQHRQVVLVLWGSGSCPEKVDAATQAGHTVTVRLHVYDQQPCTMDLRPAVTTITLPRSAPTPTKVESTDFTVRVRPAPAR